MEQCQQYEGLCNNKHEYAQMHVSVCVSEGEKERQRESVSVSVCTCMIVCVLQLHNDGHTQPSTTTSFGPQESRLF